VKRTLLDQAPFAELNTSAKDLHEVDHDAHLEGGERKPASATLHAAVAA
jgi:hypothetical protein